MAIVYGEDDEVWVSADDQVYVDMAGTNSRYRLGGEEDRYTLGQHLRFGGIDRYLLHQYRVVDNNNKDAIKIKLNLKSSYAPSQMPIYLQIWNVVNGAWETLTSDGSTAADTDFDLESTVSSNVGNYYDSSYEVAVRVYQQKKAEGSTLSVDLFQLCFQILYADKYSTQGTSYTDKYASQGTAYQDKYSAKSTSYTDKYTSKRCD